MIKFTHILFWAFISLGLLNSCGSKKIIYSGSGELRNISDAKLITLVESNYIDYNTLFVKKFDAKIDIKGESNSFKGNLYIQKDSSIIVSIMPLMGIELARIKFTPDSIYIIDRSKRQIIQSDYNYLWKKFKLDLDFYTVLRILTNELHVFPGSDNMQTDLKKYKHYTNSDHYQLNSVKKNKMTRINKRDEEGSLIYHQLQINPDEFKISESFVKDYNSNSKLTIQYSEYVRVNNKLFPTIIDINGQNESEKFHFNISFPSVNIDSDHQIGFKLSTKYSRLNY